MFHTHEQSGYHQDSMARMLAFKEMYAAPTRGVDSMLNKEWEERIRNNTAVLRSFLECVLFCGRQRFSLRGHRDDSTTSDEGNKGNFGELVRKMK